MRELMERAYKNAIERGKLNLMKDYFHIQWDLEEALRLEMAEWVFAKGMSKHLKNRSEYAEELADIMIVCLTIAKHNGIDIETIIREKLEYNEQRKD